MHLSLFLSLSVDGCVRVCVSYSYCCVVSPLVQHQWISAVNQCSEVRSFLVSAVSWFLSRLTGQIVIFFQILSLRLTARFLSYSQLVLSAVSGTLAHINMRIIHENYSQMTVGLLHKSPRSCSLRSKIKSKARKQAKTNYKVVFQTHAVVEQELERLVTHYFILFLINFNFLFLLTCNWFKKCVRKGLEGICMFLQDRLSLNN